MAKLNNQSLLALFFIMIGDSINCITIINDTGRKVNVQLSSDTNYKAVIAKKGTLKIEDLDEKFRIYFDITCKAPFFPLEEGETKIKYEKFLEFYTSIDLDLIGNSIAIDNAIITLSIAKEALNLEAKEILPHMTHREFLKAEISNIPKASVPKSHELKQDINKTHKRQAAAINGELKLPANR